MADDDQPKDIKLRNLDASGGSEPLDGFYIEGAVRFGTKVPKAVLVEAVEHFRNLLGKIAKHYDGKAEGKVHVAGVEFVEPKAVPDEQDIAQQVEAWYTQHSKKPETIH